MKYIAHRFWMLLATVLAGTLFGEWVGGVFLGGWAEGMIFGGIGGAVLGMLLGMLLGILYDPRAAAYTVPPRGGEPSPGKRDDYRP
jgi:hypothetical protein